MYSEDVSRACETVYIIDILKLATSIHALWPTSSAARALRFQITCPSYLLILSIGGKMVLCFQESGSL